MIDVEELDIFLKALFYWLNFDLYHKHFKILEDLFSWKDFFDKNERVFSSPSYFQRFGFIMKPVTARGMFGTVELKTKRGDLFFPVPGLSIYPRLLYYGGYLPEIDDFEKHEYFFMYYPKLMRPVFAKDSKLGITMGWTMGTARFDKEADKHLIAYNVAVPVGTHTVIEEELHVLGIKVHGLPKVDEVMKQIEAKDPSLIHDIEDSLNRILSTEENRFRQLGDSLRREFSSELHLMSDFVSKFESSLIESIELSLKK